MEFCVECGKECELYEHLCEDCFRKKKTFVKLPEIIDAPVCTYCNAVNIGARWIMTDSTDASVKKVINDSVSVNKNAEVVEVSSALNYKDKRTLTAKIEITLMVGKLVIKEQYQRDVRIKYSVCKQCSRAFRGYYEAIIQIRGYESNKIREKDVREASIIIADYFSKERNEKEFITKQEAVRGGVDFYLSSTTAARAVAAILRDKFNTRTFETASIAGRKDGVDIYRTTILIRIPKYKEGDFIAIDENVSRILDVRKSVIKLFDLSMRETRVTDMESISNAEVLGDEGLISNAAVVSTGDKLIKILDPETRTEVEIEKPKKFNVKGKTVKVIRYNDILYIV
ncbi:MAG: NMD3-related protein [Thermoplasmata archaeon]